VIAESLRAAKGKAVVSYSGGRDSVVMAELVREQAPKIQLCYVDTGLADPRLVAWIKRHGGKHLVYLQAETHPETTWKTEGALPIGAKMSAANYRKDNPELRVDPSRCCQIHKAKPQNTWLREYGCKLLFFGARGDDSNRHRFKLMSGEVFPSGLGWLLSYPLLVWTQRDVLEYLRETMPDYPLMYARNEELGCRACAINLARWPNQMQKLRASDPDYHRHLMSECGYAEQIVMIKYGLTSVGAKALIERDGIDQLIESGALDRIPPSQKGHR
jgi:3'-phosphoadenosine 5'-phosphosulfate sulfotransferase (PAPS reductase)/FAD synthetase